MSVAIRCGNNQCERYYSPKHSRCPNCGEDERVKKYYVRCAGKAIYAGNSLKIAREMDVKMRMDIRLGKIEAYNKPKDLLFADFIKKYYEPHYCNKKSADSIKTKVEYFLKEFKDRYLRSITPAEIERAVTVKGVGVSPRTRDYYLAVIRHIYNYAVSLELIDKSPVKVKELKVDNTRHRYLTDEEVTRLLEECRKSKSSHLYPVVMIALHTGMRIGEIRTLKKASIKSGMIYVKSEFTKNSRSKIIPLNATLEKYISEYLLRNEEFDFNHDYKKAFNHAVKTAGIEDFHFHDLRHTFASKLKAQNINDSVIQKLLGHRTPAMVQRYAHLSPESVLKAIEVVDYAK